tara:strand:- start:398 stop:784 length:387 start_codon:yes stop_codon:yes gene_type:complete
MTAFDKAWRLLKDEDDRSQARSDWRQNVRDQLASGDASQSDIGNPEPAPGPDADILQALMDALSGRTPQHMQPDESGGIQCPQCGKTHVPTGRDEQGRAMGDTPMQREGNISGLCSDECWDKFLGVGE